jgi:hypothetical protein
MIAIGDPSQDRVLVKQHRTGPSWHTTSRKILPMLAASAVQGVAGNAPNAALAFQQAFRRSRVPIPW